VSLAIAASKRLAKDMVSTLDAAKQADSVDSALSLVIAALRVAGADNLDNLEAWTEGKKAESAGAATDYGKTLATLLDKHGETLTDESIAQAIESLRQLQLQLQRLHVQEQILAKSQEAAALRLEFAASQKKAAAAAKRAATIAAKKAA
jgi:hypothetical protein